MRASTIGKELERATKELQNLRGELPNFERLYSDNQAAEAKVKEAQRNGDATLKDLSAARGRVVEARELLEQHRSDISTLEVQIATLQERYDKQSAGERLAVAKEHHETLMTEYRDSVRHTLGTVQEALRGQLEKRGQVEARRAEIESLGLKLGIYQRNMVPYSTRRVQGTGFSRLYPAVLPGLFDETFPGLRSDQQVLELLEQIVQVDEVVTTGETRQVLAHREAHRIAAIHERNAQLQAEAKGRV